MNRRTGFLDPKRKLVDEVVDWLCVDGRIRRTLEGAYSLSHLLVIVPTAQSARNLRLGLAKRAAEAGWNGLLPPLIAMPNALLVPRELRVATEAEELSVLASVLSQTDVGRCRALLPKVPDERTVDWALDLAGTLLGIEKILGERALLMSEVRPEIDRERWEELSEIEERFFAELRAQGVVSRSEARRAAVAAGCVEDGIEEIVLPSAVDLQGAFTGYLENSSQVVTILLHADEADVGKFDEWGRPVGAFAAEIDPGMVESSPNAVVEADEIARYFRGVKPQEALPALAVCDAEMYPELEGAFQNYFSDEELVLRNPAQEKLSRTSLGRLLAAIVRLGAERDYEMFSTFVRTGDVARWAALALEVTPAKIAEYVGALDAVQNAHLPRTIEEVVSGAETEAKGAWSQKDREAAKGLARLAKAVLVELGEPFVFLRKIFASVTLDEKSPGDRELIAAAKVVRELRDFCSSPLISERHRGNLFARLLTSATFMLEPTADNVLATIGWLEVQWCPEDELVIAGFNEGCVPENIVGHPFVPDSLRKEMGLSTNAGRESRDSFIFARAVGCRAKGAVSVHLHQIAGDRNVMKPSRILFSGIRDRDLPSLALRLYAVTKGNEGAPAKELPPAWRIRLPLPPKGSVFRERISATALDQYLRCPFSFYLKEVFGEKSDDCRKELDALAFGNLCHGALDRFAREGPKDSTSADEIADYLADDVRGRLGAFGSPLPAIIELQGEAAIERLKAFARLQAARRRGGWRIVASELDLRCRIKECPTVLSGKVDRIDRQESTGELAIIDYKTWDNSGRAKFYSIDRQGRIRWESLQLPIYRAMVEASNLYDPEKARSSKAFYCILAARSEDVAFDDGPGRFCHEGLQSAAEDEVVRLLNSIARGVFYPPRGKYEEYAPLIWESPEKGLAHGWLADQMSRMEVKE